MTDPWLAQSSNIENKNSEHQQTVLEFEDNFTQERQKSNNNVVTENGIGNRNSNEHQPLPDSDTYLQGLERKLQKLKKDSKLVEALAEKRDDCLRSLLQGGEENTTTSTDNAQLELDTPIGSGSSDSAVQEIYRHLQPVQAVTVGEIVHIVKYDQLDQQRNEIEGEQEGGEKED